MTLIVLISTCSSSAMSMFFLASSSAFFLAAILAAFLSAFFCFLCRRTWWGWLLGWGWCCPGDRVLPCYCLQYFHCSNLLALLLLLLVVRSLPGGSGCGGCGCCSCGRGCGHVGQSLPDEVVRQACDEQLMFTKRLTKSWTKSTLKNKVLRLVTCDESPASIVDDRVFRELTSLNSGLPVNVESLIIVIITFHYSPQIWEVWSICKTRDGKACTNILVLLIGSFTPISGVLR